VYTIEATYRVVTPLFAGGADQRSTVEIRPTAFKRGTALLVPGGDAAVLWR
jgi:hypothetical protein